MPATAKPINQIIEKVVKKFGWEDEFDAGRIEGEWYSVVDEVVAKNCRFHRFAKGVLYINTTSSTWRTELIIRKEMLLAKLNQQLGKQIVKDIIIK